LFSGGSIATAVGTAAWWALRLARKKQELRALKAEVDRFEEQQKLESDMDALVAGFQQQYAKKLLDELSLSASPEERQRLAHELGELQSMISDRGINILAAPRGKAAEAADASAGFPAREDYARLREGVTALLGEGAKGE
jgi:hypothetical protein